MRSPVSGLGSTGRVDESAHRIARGSSLWNPAVCPVWHPPLQRLAAEGAGFETIRRISWPRSTYSRVDASAGMPSTRPRVERATRPWLAGSVQRSVQARTSPVCLRPASTGTSVPPCLQTTVSLETRAATRTMQVSMARPTLFQRSRSNREIIAAVDNHKRPAN